MADDQPTREELVAARDDIERQLGFLESPIRALDLNPRLIAKLRALLAEYNDTLASWDSDHS
jgi:hypothetical protein